jgi:hypothetical protein
MADEDKVSRRYRELPREEPPRHVDEAILAAARRAVEARPAPLVPPAGRRRWYFPLAAAAIIVLAVAVTMHVERERPDLEIAVAPVTAPAPAPQQLPEAAPAQALEKRKALVSDAQPPAAAPAVPPPTQLQEKPARRDEETVRSEVASRAPLRPEGTSALKTQRAAADALGGVAAESPEQWLERIAELRRQGRHEEADKALAEFRRAYPDYRIPEATLERVEKR